MNPVLRQPSEKYIASQPEAAEIALKRVRDAVRKALPGAEEVISCKMPTYKLHGDRVLFFALWKNHYSLYPAGVRLVAAFKEQLAPYKVNKSTFRFPSPFP